MKFKIYTVIVNLNSPYNQINQQQTFGDTFDICSFHQEA